MVNNFYKHLVLFILTMLSFNSKAASSEEPSLFIDYDIASKTVYVDQPFTLSIVLYSTSPDVVYANKSSNISLKKGDFDFIRKIDSYTRPYKKVIDRKTYYCFALETYLLSFNKKGNYTLAGRTFDIGISYPAVINDPFWGPVRTVETKSYQVVLKDFSFKVKSLPSPPSGENFSGAVGDFTVETVVPKGDIIVNEEAIAYVIVKGQGSFKEATLPEYKSAFSNGLKLKSVAENRTEYWDNGKLISEIRLECTFVPEREGDLNIGKVSFDYFNTKSGKYVRTDSKPIPIIVKSSVTKRDKISI